MNEPKRDGDPKPPGSDSAYTPLKEQLESLKKSGSQLNAAGTTFILICVYLALAAAATTHRDLVVGRTLVLPLLDVQLPVRGFYSVAPLLVVLLHVNLMIMEVLFQKKRERFVKALGEPIEPLPDPEDIDLADSFGVSLSVRAILNRATGSWWLNWALRLMFLVLNLVAPLGVLLLLQAQFMPLHHTIIRWEHLTFAVVDILLVAFFVPKILSPTGEYLGWYQPREYQNWRALQTVSRTAIVVLLVAGVFWLSFVWLMPRGDHGCAPSLPFPFATWNWSDLRWPKRNLNLADDPTAFDTPVRLIRQDLRCADFSGLDLSKADLRGSVLENASFDRATLRGARMSPSSAWAESEEGRTILTGATFRDASLVKADLERAVLDHAHLDGADLRQARLDKADLTEAHMAESRLSGASLREAVLDEAELSRAIMVATDLGGAFIRGAHLAEVGAICASFREAQMDYSVLFGADLAFGDFTETSARGTDFRHANLGYADGLVLSNQSLRGAKMAGFCSEPVVRGSLQPTSYTKRTHRPTLSDLREVVWNEPTASDLQAMAKEVGDRASRAKALEEASEEKRVGDPPDALSACRDRIAGKVADLAKEKEKAQEKDKDKDTTPTQAAESFPCMWSEGIHGGTVTNDRNLFSRRALVQLGVDRDALSVAEMADLPHWKDVYLARGEDLVATACTDPVRLAHLEHRFVDDPLEVEEQLAWAVRVSLNERVRKILDRRSADRSECPALAGTGVTDLQDLWARTLVVDPPDRWYSFSREEP